MIAFSLPSSASWRGVEATNRGGRLPESVIWVSRCQSL
jgi:hypothetical protein